MDSAPIRTKWMNPDFRRYPKTDRFCVICQRDLKEGQPFRTVAWEVDKYEAIHSEDWERAEVEIRERRQCNDPFQRGPIGMDCAKRLGLEWSR